MMAGLAGVSAWATWATMTAQAATGPTTRLADVPPAGLSFDLGCDGFQLAVSADGHLVAFTCNIHGFQQVFVRNLTTRRTRMLSVNTRGVPGNGDSFDPAISNDGHVVAFASNATNMVGHDANGFHADVFVRSRRSGRTTLASVNSRGVQGNLDSGGVGLSISGSGRLVAFSSVASNLVKHDTNDAGDIFVHDRVTGRTTRVSVSSTGQQVNSDSRECRISGNGRAVVFRSFASNLVSGDSNRHSDIFVHSRKTGRTTRVSVNSSGGQADSGSSLPVISADGRIVAFQSFSTNLVAGDTNGQADIFVHNRWSGGTARVDVSSGGGQADVGATEPSISADGSRVAFATSSTNLVAGDTNATTDVFMRDRAAGTTTRVSLTASGGQANGQSIQPAISPAGNVVAFYSFATNLPGPRTSGNADIFTRGPLA